MRTPERGLALTGYTPPVALSRRCCRCTSPSTRTAALRLPRRCTPETTPCCSSSPFVPTATTRTRRRPTFGLTSTTRTTASTNSPATATRRPVRPGVLSHSARMRACFGWVWAGRVGDRLPLYWWLCDPTAGSVAPPGCLASGLMEFDLNSPEGIPRLYGPYPVNRAVSGLKVRSPSRPHRALWCCVCGAGRNRACGWRRSVCVCVCGLRAAVSLPS